MKFVEKAHCDVQANIISSQPAEVPRDPQKLVQQHLTNNYCSLINSNTPNEKGEDESIYQPRTDQLLPTGCPIFR